MPILDQYGNPISSGSSKFANSAVRGDRSAPAEPIFLDDFDKLIPEQDRKTLLSGSRKMFQNYGPTRGAIIQKADNVIGRAWDPVFSGGDKEWGKLAADWLRNTWYGMCDVRGPDFDFKTLLWLDSVAVDRDGDVLVIFEEGADGWPLTRRVGANRIGQRVIGNYILSEGPYKGRRINHGVIFGDYNRPIAFRVLGDLPADDVDIPANNCIRIMDPMWHDQSRGEPGFSNALKFIRSSLLSHEWEQMAQLMVSSIGLVEYNESGGPDYDDPSISVTTASEEDPRPPTIETLAGGTVRYVRANSGGKIEQLKHERPNDMWDRFQDRVIRIAMAGVNWPYELVWKANEVNGVLVRNIQERARLSVEDRQDTLRGPARRQLIRAVAKAIKEGILPAPKNRDDWWRWDFSMPRKFSIDPGREAAQRREDYKMGLKNRTQIATEEGWNVDEMDDQRITEVVNREAKIKAAEEAHGPIDRRLIYMLTPNELAQSAPAASPNTQPEKEESE